MTAEIVLQRYRSGEISREIALMQLLLTLGSLAALDQCLAAAEFAPLADAAAAHRDGLARTAALIEGGLIESGPAEGRDAVAATRRQFDRAVTVAPEASVALYSLGSPAVLARATAEIVVRLREWGLVARHSRVLDIGCGIGRIEIALAPHVATITGIDVAPNMIAEARRRCADYPNILLACGTGYDLAGFAADSFELVLAVDSFPYLVAADPAIADRHVEDAARLLRAGGALAVFNYSYSGDLDRDRAAIADLATRHGFTVERDGTRDFALWDGATYLLRNSP